ncbi:mechanosensitive ion channel family protein [Niabella ginsengisoli]|uniref:Mechanosensitive ion channel family protein n=1 Tax=Niabella ginsengisoli TaxID=522298 RepID=A0ABS9SIB3_9BACT|nr:mechanosensitive ion channel family protein [Niabella ginsengisoli]MCH5598085.1 mechanosensitive ion channel family protein [Niabella ginsengisoli]
MYVFALRLINAVIEYAILSFLKTKEDGDIKQRQAKGLLVIVKVIVWIFGIVFLLDNFGYNVTTIVAGLGIGGIAIALAAQAILGDLFSYFVILFDRPFEIGDFLVVDDKVGTVEYIGIKTTRLRTLQGEQLICSNKDLTDSRVHNFKEMEKRRVVFALGVTYQTDAETLAQIPELVKEIIEKNEDVVYDRGHFSGFGDFSLNFEFVYYMLSSDFNIHMDTQQRIYLDIYREFEKRNIEFAFPTQTLFVNNESKIPQAEYN